jgi:Na+/phosphate symporter
MLIAIFPLLILVLGILLWALATNPVLKEAGRIMFFCGLLVVCFIAAKQAIRIF